MTPEEVSAGLDKQLLEIFGLYPRPNDAIFWEAVAKVYRTYTEPALVAWRKDRVRLSDLERTCRRAKDALEVGEPDAAFVILGGKEE